MILTDPFTEPKYTNASVFPTLNSYELISIAPAYLSEMNTSFYSVQDCLSLQGPAGKLEFEMLAVHLRDGPLMIVGEKKKLLNDP